ncbi:thermonuclease family protein [Candidatus Bathyarchaeota archaeon]|nr:thermonuclease family protein [Candidatus Bathyarchaeota archaeon]
MFKKITFILIIILSLFSVPNCLAYEIDVVAPVTQVIDGDSFYIQGDEVRLADVSCPEWYASGGSEATDALTELIDGQIVYLDTDQKTGRDKYGRLIAVVYVVFNESHLLNVNELMLLLGHAELTDYTNNEFDPYTWTLLERYAYVEPETSDSSEEIAALRARVDELTEELVSITEEYNQLYSNYEPLFEEYIALLDRYNEMNTSYCELDTAYKELLEAQNKDSSGIPGYSLISILVGISLFVACMQSGFFYHTPSRKSR